MSLLNYAYYLKNNHNKNAEGKKEKRLLSIGTRNPYLQTAGIKKQKQASGKQLQKPSASNVSKGSASVSRSSAPAVGMLEAMAMNNLVQNNSMPAEMKQPAFESINAQVLKGMQSAKANVSSISSKLNQTKSELAGVQSMMSSSDDKSDKETAIYQLIASALQSEVKSFEALLSKAKYEESGLSQLASFGVNQVVGESAQSPALLEMLSSTNTEYSSEATTKLLHQSSNSAKATRKLGGLVQSGKISLKKSAIEAKKQDPQKTAEGLDNLNRTVSLSKADRLGVAQVLTSIAVENPLNGAGKAAASGLEYMFKKDTGSVARNAAVGLRVAAIAGNGHATDGLINVATSPVAGKSKNIEAIQQLTRVAKTGTSQSQKATSVISKMAMSSNVGGDVKETCINSLGQIAYNGGNNGKLALDTLGTIASDDKNPSQKQAVSNILKLESHKALGNSKVVKAFANIAESNRTDMKMKKTATKQLGDAMLVGGSASGQKAQDSLTKVMTNPNNKAAGEAGFQLNKQGMNNSSKTNINKVNHQFAGNATNPFLAAKSKKGENPFFQNNLFAKPHALKAVSF